MKHTLLLAILLIVASISKAQSFRYIDITDGLSNQNVYTIQKDRKGYMWMLTMSGIDRYNGKEFRHYSPGDGIEEPGWLFMLHRLHVDAHGDVWLVSMREGIMLYDSTLDTFLPIATLPHQSAGKRPLCEITSSFIDSHNYLWILSAGDVLLWDIAARQLFTLNTTLPDAPLAITQTGEDSYAVATSCGISLCRREGSALKSERFIPFTAGMKLTRVNSLAASADGKHLFVATDRHGLISIDTDGQCHQRTVIPDLCVNVVRRFKGDSYLVATDRAGIWLLDINTLTVKPYLTADYESPNDIDSNDIRDIYIDDEERIWMACNPYGVTVLTNGLPRYAWLRHTSNTQSIANNNINHICEDSDGDLWFATDNGISLHRSADRSWRSLLNSTSTGSEKPFLAICQVAPGVMWATGYTDDIYIIRKPTLKAERLATRAAAGEACADKYVQALCCDSEGYVWLGGFYTLRRVHPATGECRYYPLDQVSCIAERDNRSLWVGTARGLYSVDKRSGAISYIRLAANRHTYICSLCQAADGSLYIGTACSGLIVYDTRRGTCRTYNSTNSTLITDNIHSIVSDADGSKLVMGTDRGLTQYDLHRQLFRNWTYDQGMLTTYFNSGSAIYTHGGYFVMGSNDGAVAFRISSWHDRPMRSRMVLSDMKINYESVHAGCEGSPLTADIDEAESITLKHDQNSFSINLSSINYDYPSDVAYTWRLLGLHSRWTRAGDEHVVRYSSLPPGNYTLQIRAVSNESSHRVLEERTISIRVAPPLWLSLPALILYFVVAVLSVWLLLRLLRMIRQRRASAEKIDFFVRTAHDLRTPLTLIKAPLDEVSHSSALGSAEHDNIAIAMRNVDNLLRLTDNLLNFERVAATAVRLCKSEIELGSYLTALLKPFIAYAESRQIALRFTDETDGKRVWADAEKIESVVKNLVSNALKYTPQGGDIRIVATCRSRSWSVEVADTGIGIPAAECGKLFRLYYRATNAVNSRVTGSGVGLMLVKRLVSMHGGKVSIRSAEGRGTTVRFVIPNRSRALSRAIPVYRLPADVLTDVELTVDSGVAQPSQRQRLLVVEDNDELRLYLKRSLEATYEVQICNNGKEALPLLSDFRPDLILSDIMMPEMRGDELCRVVKSNIETSHIPVVLLTALASEGDMAHGFACNADGYIAKPFGMELLRARIESLLANRRMLWRKYAAGSGVEMSQSEVDGLTELDRRFLDDVRRHVDSNIDNQEFTVDTLCALLNMSRTSFYNKVKSLTGSSPSDIIREMRLTRATQLLKGGHSVTEVAYRTGFNDAKYFREVFKRRYKVSPTEYRNK